MVETSEVCHSELFEMKKNNLLSPRVFFSIFSYTSYTFRGNYQSVLQIFRCKMA